MSEIDWGGSKLIGYSGPKLQRIIMVASIVAILFASSLSLLSVPSFEAPLAPTPARIISLTPHVTISIVGDAQFNNTNFPNNGVVSGNGSASNPYIISGWDVNASAAHGIVIQNTNAYFEVRDCFVHYGTTSYLGIILNNVANGTLSSNNCSKNRFGITVFLSDGIIVQNNTCLSNEYYGIFLRLSNNSNMLINNTCLNNQQGILLRSSNSSNVLSDNNCSSNSQNGIWFDYSTNNTLSNNTCSSNSNYGIHLVSSNGNTLSNNNCNLNTQDGMRLESSSDNNTIRNNTCNSNTNYGMDIGGSSQNTLTNNTCSNNDEGIDVIGSSLNILSGNNFSSNTYYGIYLQGSSNNTLFDNDCRGTTGGYGIALISLSNNNTLDSNNCSSNGQYGIYLWISSYNAINNNTCWYNLRGVSFESSSNRNTLFNNTCSNNSNGVTLSMSSYNTIAWNRFCNNTAHGTFAAPGGDWNTIWNNTFIGNNGVTGVYNPSNTQANDDGSNNQWNSSSGFGNYWSDLTSPDAVLPFGIVDWSYNLTGGFGTSMDYYPLTTPSPVPAVIPEFSEIVVPIVGLMLIALVFGRARKKP